MLTGAAGTTITTIEKSVAAAMDIRNCRKQRDSAPDRATRKGSVQYGRSRQHRRVASRFEDSEEERLAEDENSGAAEGDDSHSPPRQEADLDFRGFKCDKEASGHYSNIKHVETRGSPLPRHRRNDGKQRDCAAADEEYYERIDGDDGGHGKELTYGDESGSTTE